MNAASHGDGHGTSDPLTDHDVRRMRKARAEARACVRRIEDVRTAALAAAFRTELGATVRSASPLLISMLALDGLSLDDASALILPQSGWPRRPRYLANRSCGGMYRGRSRNHAAGMPLGGITIPPFHSVMFSDPRGLCFQLEVIDHSLEVSAWFGPVFMSTRSGELRVEFYDGVPHTLLVASVGRLIEEFVDHEALRGQGWRIVALEDSILPEFGQVLVVATGSVEYRMPWARVSCCDLGVQDDVDPPLYRRDTVR